MKGLTAFALLIILRNSFCAIPNFFTPILTYFSRFTHQQVDVNGSELITKLPHIPYEVTPIEEKFIQDAAKLTGIALSELDSCQQRVVLKLKSECTKLNDEELAKLSVALLNCQSYVEGRKMFPCTDEMSIRQCTAPMDPDTWTSYHLMSNRARAVCYTVRQAQFRGSAELTVNRLMSMAENQQNLLDQMQTTHYDVLETIQSAYSELNEGQNIMLKQQKDMENAQFQGLLVLENLINRLSSSETQLINEAVKGVQLVVQSSTERVNEFSKKIKDHIDHNMETISKLFRDIDQMHEKTQKLLQMIDAYGQILNQQNSELQKHYKSTIDNLSNINATSHSVWNFIKNGSDTMNSNLLRMDEYLKQNDISVERIFQMSWHALFLLITLTLSLNWLARYFVLIVTIANLLLATQNNFQLNTSNLTPVQLALVLLSAICTQELAKKLVILVYGKRKNIRNDYSQVDAAPSNPHLVQDYKIPRRLNDSYDFSVLRNCTAPSLHGGSVSRSGTPTNSVCDSQLSTSRNLCQASTKQGYACKLGSVNGTLFCRRHQDPVS